MVHITVKQTSKKECVGFHVIGHAGSGEYGQDIVCAAVSVLVQNTVNAIEKFTCEEFSTVSNEEEGLLDFQIKGKPDKEAALLLKAMLLGLEDIAKDENYKKNVTLIYEEV